VKFVANLCLTMPSMKGMPTPTKVLASPTGSPPKTVARRTPFHLDDPQYDADRTPQYGELSTTCLSTAAAKEAVAKERRKEEAAIWAARQKASQEVAAAETARLKGLRKIELERVKGRVEEAKQADKDKERFVIDKTVKEQTSMKEEMSRFDSRELVIKTNEKEYYNMEMERRAGAGNEALEYANKKKADREEEAARIQKEIRLKTEAHEKAAKGFAKRSKAELALETKKQHETELKKQQQRDKEGAAGRTSNIHYANTHADRLHWEPPPSPVHIAAYAKQIRERGESPTGK